MGVLRGRFSTNSVSEDSRSPLLSRSAGSRTEYVYIVGEPQPHKFEINGLVEMGDYTFGSVTYPDCQNYNGVKLLVWSGKMETKITNTKILDPHFLQNELSPMARFKPSIDGINAMVTLCCGLTGVTKSIAESSIRKLTEKI